MAYWINKLYHIYFLHKNCIFHLSNVLLIIVLVDITFYTINLQIKLTQNFNNLNLYFEIPSINLHL